MGGGGKKGGFELPIGDVRLLRLCSSESTEGSKRGICDTSSQAENSSRKLGRPSGSGIF